MSIKSELLNVLRERGYIYQFTDEVALEKLLLSTKIKGYIGFDCTAPSLHVGSLMQIMMLRILQKFGHDPIILLGSATTRVGDPSGKDQTRSILSAEEILYNQQSIAKIFAQFIDLDSGTIFVDNAEWLLKLNYLEFLSEYGSHFTINRMLTFDSVKLRLDRQQPLTFLEFNYMLLQAYDFLELNRRYGCVLQLGGSDQWGNIVTGIELIRKINKLDAFGVTSTLLTTASGTKMGKTVKGAIWLNEDMLSHYDYWQFWRNVEDADVIKFLKLFTEIPLHEIEKLSNLQGTELNEAKIILANEATTLCRGLDASKAAKLTAQNTFGDFDIESELNKIELSQETLSNGIPVFQILFDAGFCSSKSEARRLISGGGAKINNKTVLSENDLISNVHIQHGVIKVSAGKKKHVALVIKK